MAQLSTKLKIKTLLGFNYLIHKLFSQSINQYVGGSVSKSGRQSVFQSVIQSVSHSDSQLISKRASLFFQIKSGGDWLKSYSLQLPR